MTRKARVFTAANGVDFYVRILDEGDQYGNGAVWEHKRAGVAFYDFRFAHQKFGPMGQQISTYFLETIMSGEGGLDLLTYADEWKIDNETMEKIRDFLLLGY